MGQQQTIERPDLEDDEEDKVEMMMDNDFRKMKQMSSEDINARD
jgi:hypothetical protein